MTDRKVAIITGASQGIGASILEAYLTKGFAVVANSRRIKASDRHDVLAVEGDVADSVTARRIVSAALERFGRVDTLVNNAGIFIPKPFTEYAADDFAQMIAVNLAGFFHITQQALVPMLEAGRGHVVTITTSLVDQPLSSVPAALASMTKGGLNAVTRSLAIEYARRGVRVNAVAPGIIKTPMHAPETHEFLAGLHPMHRMGEIGEIVDAVLYLEQAGFVTGEVLHVDGGQHAGHW